MTVQQIYSNAKQRRYPPKWDEKEPEASLLIYLTDSIRIRCGRCGASLGIFVAYWAGAEYGIMRDVARHYHQLGNFPPDEFANSPHDRFTAKDPVFDIDGEKAGKASKAFANFRCPRCGLGVTRNLRRFGTELFEARPGRYELKP
jgi:ribosomal protein S27AE